MSTPVYHGGGYNRGRGYRHRRWGRTAEPTGNGWLDQVGTWFGGAIPRYAGQPTAGPVGGGSPVYKPAPSSIGNAGTALATAQADVPVFVAPPR